MRIGEVADGAGVGVETVRFYEQRGLIGRPPRPNDGGYRIYPEETVRRIRFVRSAQQLGFSLGEILDLLDLKAGPDARCIDVRARARAKLVEVELKIDKLGRIRGALEELISACPGKGPARKCSILEEINSGDLHLDTLDTGEQNGE
ncbi:MAG: MerR family transcriptional regulator [Alphaproteobacteria bacterium]